MNQKLPHKSLTCDLCIVGGGLSGCFAALAAARHGATVVLIQDRPVLGGNASSEIRMWVRGAKGKYDRETGFISELEERNIHGNPTLVHSLFDATLYGMLKENSNITILLNTSCMDAEMDDNRIVSVSAWQGTTYTFFDVTAKIFADCSGDSILAPLTGAKFRKGRESKEEFGETLAQDKEDTCTMGMSLMLAARETDHPVKFIPPAFASYYPTDEAFSSKKDSDEGVQKRDHEVGTSGTNLWWVELGGNGDSIADSDVVRDKLLANVYGVWDHIKNQGEHGKENWDLDWVGALPGKRESRRYEGMFIVKEQDILSGGNFEDEIAFGGWPLDDHNPFGMEPNPYDNHASVMIPVEQIYGLPYRALVSDNIENLMFAGRNISVTHVALSSTRVMATCSLLGQALGTGAAVAIKYDCKPEQVYYDHIKEVQKKLMDDGVFLPHHLRIPSKQTLCARTNLTTEQEDILFNGMERPRTDDDENGIYQEIGDSLCFYFEKPEKLEVLRLRFDPDYSRESISVNKKMRVFAMKLHTGADFRPVKTADTIVKSFVVYADGKEVYRTEDNYLSLVKVPLNLTAKEIRIEWKETHGSSKVHLFAADFINEKK